MTHSPNPWSSSSAGTEPVARGGLASVSAMDITATDEWAALLATPRPAPLRDLFAADLARADRYTTVAGDLRVDWSKHLVDERVMAALMAVAARSGVEAHRDAMFRGDRINPTEDRPVLHTALRAPRTARIEIGRAHV